MKRFLMVLVVLAWSAVPTLAWRSTLYPTNWQPPTVDSADFESGKLIQDFSYAGYQAGEAPVPEVTGPLFNAALPPYNADATGLSDATVAIQGAINAAGSAGGGVVFLPAGLYRVSPQGSASYALRINSPAVVLRGAGVGQSFLLNTATNMRSKSVILIEGPSNAAFYSTGAGSTTLTTNLMGPTTVLPVSSTTGFTPGQWVVVRADCTDDWITEHNEPGWIGYGSTLKGPAYFRKLLAVDAAAKTLTVDVPTRYYLKTRDNARVVRLSASPITGIGLEDFSLGNVQHPGSGWGEEDYNYSTNAAYDVHNSFLVRVVRARDSWIQRVESFQAASNTFTCHLLSNGILVNDSSRVTLREVHLQRPQYGGGGGNGYMYRVQSANDCLIQDCRATFSRHGFVLSHMGSAGNVFHRCTDTDTGKQTGNTGSQNTSGKSSDHHMHFSHSNLLDVNTGDSSWWEARYRPFGTVPLHNLTAAHGVYWNTLGIGSGVTYVVQTEQSRYGYAIGTRGTRSGVNLPTFGGTKCDPVDHVEGVGQGDTLEPFSLYEDQLIRRLQLPEVQVPGEVTLLFPSNSVRLSAAVQIGRQPAAPGSYALNWRAVNGAGEVTFSSPTVQSPWVTFSERGAHQLEVVVSAGGHSATGAVTVILAPDQTLVAETHPCVADTYVRDGTYSGDNYGASTALHLKKSSTGFNRRAFLRFDLTAATNTPYSQAFLELHAPAPVGPTSIAQAEAWLVTNDLWVESEVTWSNQPALNTLVTGWSTATSGVERIEVTPAALAEASGDGQLSLGLQIASQPGDLVYQYRSREAAAEVRPQLVLERAQAAPDYAAWILGYPTLPPTLRDPEDNPDQDDLNNAEEYLFGRNPALADGAGVWTFVRASSGWALEFPQRKGLPADFTYVIETSGALVGGQWQAAPGIEFALLLDLGDTVRMRAFIPEEPFTAQRFYRFRLQVGTGM